MGAGPIVECVFCIQRMANAEGWMVWPRPAGGALEYICPSCRTRSDAPCVCGHENGAHDMVGTRFCAATADGGLERECACPSGQVTVRARSYDWR